MRSVPLGELPPPPPGTCFGRDKLIEEVIDIAENLESVALIGAGGIGKTSIALAVLHHDRVKDRFGNNRRFIRCDQFPASRLHFLARLSQVVGAGVENPEDLIPLRPFLSSVKMILFLDNVESILDPQGTDSREIYAVVEELGRFKNICLGITSRITTVPPRFHRPIVPTLSMESACDIFYGIYTNDRRSNIINDLVRQLDFHALSITLLATTASHNLWDYKRLAKEWETNRVHVLRTDHNESLAATIELSLASPTFRQLTPPPKFHKLVTSRTFSRFIPPSILHKSPLSARELLEVVAFFPQGIDEKNLDWLFPATPDRKKIIDKFCVLSLAHRNNGFITMLAPIRDYLCPVDPKSSSSLRATRDRYFTRLSVHLFPDEPGFEEAQWIKSEDANIEHLLDVFTSIDPNARDVWKVCRYFLQHLYWHKRRQTVLRSKIESLPDRHHSKAKCMFELSKLFRSVGNHAEEKRLLTHTLMLERKKRSAFRIAETLRLLSDVNRTLGLHREGIEQAKEASKIFKRLGNTMGQANCLKSLAWLLLDDGQLDAAENTALRTINLLPEKGEDFLVCGSHRVLGVIYGGKGEKEKAIGHFKMALQIASSFNWEDQQFWIHHSMAHLFLAEDEFEDANIHTKQAKSHTVDNTYNLGHAMNQQAEIWCQQRRLGDAKREALGALEIYQELGAADDARACNELLQEIDGVVKRKSRPTSKGRPGLFRREFSDHDATFIPANSPILRHDTENPAEALIKDLCRRLVPGHDMIHSLFHILHHTLEIGRAHV